MALFAYKGKRGTRYGYRFHFRGQLHKKIIGSQRALALEAEKRERRRLEGLAFEASWGPLSPRLTTWPEALTQYETAKAQKASLMLDLTRLRWWQDSLSGQGIHYLQVLTPEAIDRGKAALFALGKTSQTVKHYLAVLRHLCNLAARRWRVLGANPVHAVDLPRVPISRRRRVLTPPERRKLLQAAALPLRGLILTALYTGLRDAMYAYCKRASGTIPSSAV